MLRMILIMMTGMLFWPVAGHSVIVTGLYEAEVPVPDQGTASQKAGVSRALLDVLVKLTGDQGIQGRSVAAHLLEKPEQYVQQYKFRNPSSIEDNQLSAGKQLYLWVSFNAGALDKALQDNSVTVWGGVRPATLIWLVVQGGQKREFVTLEDDNGFTAILDNRAQQRGIPVIHPLLDPEDRVLVKETDVIGGFLEPVRQASQRYTPDAILVGNLSSTSNASWDGRWTLLLNNEPITWSGAGESANHVLQAAIDRLADTLATRFVQTTAAGSGSGIEVVVRDITDFDQYSKVLKYLRTLNSVVNVEVKTVEPGSVSFLVTATGGELAVLRSIELGKTLESLTGTGSPYRLLQ